MIRSFSFVLLLACAVSQAEEVKQELRLTAAEIFARSTSRNVRLTADGKAIETIPGKLFESDGAAAGFSYKPNEEPLDAGTVAVKKFWTSWLGPLPPKAWLLVGHTGKELKATINGQPVELGEPKKAGNYWKCYEIPTTHFKSAHTEVALSGDGKLWIARQDDLNEMQEPLKQTLGHQSYKRGPDGKKSEKLGPNNDIEGEYYVRLLLPDYREKGNIDLDIDDVANLSGNEIPPQSVQVRRVSCEFEGDWPFTGPIVFAGKRAENPQEPYFEMVLVQRLKGELVGDKARRSFSLRIGFPDVDFSKVHRLSAVKITSVCDMPATTEKPKILAQHNPLIPADDGFEFEDLAHPRLAEFRKQYALDDVVKDCTTDLQRMERLAVWTSQQWTKGHLSKIYPKWDALDILKEHDDGTPVGGFCQQYSIVFLQACESFGMPGRCVSIGAGDHGVKIRSGHEVIEIWSNELNKWVYVDGQAAWYFVDKETRTPLNLLELRERQLAVLLDKASSPAAKRPVDVVVLAKSPHEWKGLQDWPAFAELRMIPHTKFLDGELPLPLNQGMRGWFWTGHRVWTDDLYPGSVLYSDFVANPHAWNWPINQTHLELQQTSTPGALTARCTHNMPGFANYVVQIDDEKERTIDRNDFAWPLHAGENRLQVRAVNVHGLRGPASWVKVSK